MRNGKKIFAIIFILFLTFYLTIGPSGANAAGPGHNTVEKAVRGTSNLLLGWTEVVNSPVQGVKDHGPLGFLSGVFLAAPKAVIRTGGGLFDLLTSPVPEKGLVGDYPLGAFTK